MTGALSYKQTTLGFFLRKARMDLGYSLREVQKITGISRSRINRLEHGDFDATVDTFVRLCVALGLPPGTLVEDCIYSDVTYFRLKLKTDDGLRVLITDNKWTAIQKEEMLISFCAGCCTKLAELLWASDPVAHSGGEVLPVKELYKPYLAAAERIKGTFSSEDRVNTITALDRTPFEELKHWGLCSIGILSACIQAFERGEGIGFHPLGGAEKTLNYGKSSFRVYPKKFRKSRTSTKSKNS